MGVPGRESGFCPTPPPLLILASLLLPFNEVTAPTMRRPTALLFLLAVGAQTRALQPVTADKTAHRSSTSTSCAAQYLSRSNDANFSVSSLTTDVSLSSLTTLLGRWSNRSTRPAAALSLSRHSSSSFSLALSVRGGANAATTAAAAAATPSAALTFGQNLAGSVFSTFATIYGLACIVAPERTARLFYGYDEDDKTNDDGVGTFLMRLMGSMCCGIGLTSAFAIGAEIKAGPGAIPSTATFDRSIGVGLVPRILLILHCIIAGSVPSNLRMVSKDAIVALIQTLLFAWSMFTTKGIGIFQPDSIITLEVAFHTLLGPLLFFKPSILFQSDNNNNKAPSKHEKFMTRMMASYSVMGAVLVGALQHPAINALPAVGLAAMVWVASLAHFTFVRKDVEECGTSVPVHVAMMIVGVLVAVGGLQQYLYLPEK